MSPETPSPKQPARSLGTGITVLKFMLSAGRPLGLTQIGSHLGISKSSMHDMLYALRELGFVEQDEATRKYSISPGIFSFIHDVAERFGPNPKLNEVILAQAETLNCGIYIHVLSGRSVFLICAAGRYAPSSSLGIETPIYASSAGKILVAQKPEDEWLDYAPRPSDMALRDRPPMSPEEFLKQVRSAREEGVAWNHGEYSASVCAVATVIPERRELPSRSVALVFPADEWPHQDRAQLAAQVKDLAGKLAEKLGITG